VNITILQVQIVIIVCPCAQTCRVPSPLNDLAERLRSEMCYGRDAHREPENLRRVISDFAPAFQMS
jgi:hypothetical protein